MVDVFGLPATLSGSLVFALGTIIGSFLNVVALRWEGDRGLIRSNRSRCLDCHAALAWYELMPVVSYLLQGGRCRHCLRPIKLRYLFVELATGLLYCLLFSAYGLTFTGFALVIISSVLEIALLVDFEQYLLPDALTVLVLVLSVLALLALESPLSHMGGSSWWYHPISGALLALGVIGGLQWGTQGKGMGLGDVKLAPVLGLTLGGVGALVALSTAFLLGAAIGLMLIAFGQARLKSAVPFGPFLIVGWWVALLWGPQLVTWYTRLAF